MPNHVRNVLKIKNLKPEEVMEIVNTITDFNPDDPLETIIIDFDKIIPEPKTKEECPEDCWITPSSRYNGRQRKTLV